MTLPTLLLDLALILVGATVLVLAARAIGAPAIVAYIVAGLALGPLLGVIAVDESLALISEVGIALLLFLVGLELSFQNVRDVGKVALAAGAVQVLVTAVAGFGVALLLGLDPAAAAFLAMALAFSSTVVVIKVLDQKRHLKRAYGRIAVGILLVQDLVVVVVLTFVAGLGRPEALEPMAIARGLLLAFGGMGLLLAVAMGASRWVLPGAFRWMSRSLEGLFIWSLCWCFLFILGAEALHLSLEVGAFLAGVSLAQLPYNQELRRRVHPLMNFFIAVFFVTLGSQMDLGAAGAYWQEALLLSALVLIGKPALFRWIIPRFGHPASTALRAGIALSQISEFSFILAAMGLSVGLIEADLFSLIGLVGLITISASTYLMAFSDSLVAAAGRVGLLPGRGAAEPASAAEAASGLTGHVIVVGMNALGRRLVHGLLDRGESVLAVDTDPEKLAGLPSRTLLGNVDQPAVLEEAGLAEAKLVVSALQIQDANNLLTYRCRQAGVPSSVHAFDESVVGELREIGAEHLILSKNAGIQEIAAELRAAGILGP